MEFKNRKGQVVPYSKFKVIENGSWRTFSTDEVFSGRRVIVFALPGAFTPTCSSAHLPRYEQLAPEFYKRGIDDIYVLSVNDTFVMNAWLDMQGIQHVKALPDGMGDFTRAMEMTTLKKDVGFGLVAAQ
jgi:peroxiredoxin